MAQPFSLTYLNVYLSSVSVKLGTNPKPSQLHRYHITQQGCRARRAACLALRTAPTDLHLRALPPNMSKIRAGLVVWISSLCAAFTMVYSPPTLQAPGAGGDGDAAPANVDDNKFDEEMGNDAGESKNCICFRVISFVRDRTTMHVTAKVEVIWAWRVFLTLKARSTSVPTAAAWQADSKNGYNEHHIYASLLSVSVFAILVVKGLPQHGCPL